MWPLSMNASFVCRNCLRRLAGRAGLRGACADFRRAGFVSLSKIKPTDSTSAAELLTAGDDGLQKIPETEVAGPSSRAGGRVSSRATEGFLGNLVSSAQRQSPAPPGNSRKTSKDSTPPCPRHEILATWVDKLPTIRGLLEKQWAALMQVYGSKDSNRSLADGMAVCDLSTVDVSPESDSDRLVEEGRLRTLLLKLTRSHTGKLGKRAGKLPTPAQAIRVYVQADIMTDYLWVKVLWILLSAVVKSRALSRRRGREREFLHPAHFSRKLLNDLLEVWKIFVDAPAAKSSGFPCATSQDTSWGTLGVVLGNLDTPADADLDWEGPPATPELVAAHTSSLTDIPDGFLSFLPRLRQSPRIHEVFAAAVMTLDLLRPDAQENYSPQAAYEKEFVQLMASVVTIKPLPFDVASRYLRREGLSLDAFLGVKSSWESLPQRGRVLSSLAGGHKASAAPEPRVTHIEKGPQTDAAIKRSLMIRAVRSGDGDAIDGLWQRMETNISRGIIADHFFSQFLWAYMCLRRPVQATHVWNRMVKLGFRPSQNHWLAMLRGCQHARDYNAIGDIWQRMDASGIRPGLRCWTIRIQGLILSGQLPQGLKALDDLSKAWDSAASPVIEHDANDHLLQLDGGTKDLLVPSIVPINAAISSLLTIGRADLVGTFLKWAESHKIPPDTTTFNILLRQAVRGNRQHDAQNILRQMESSQCQPDTHTFTIIIDGLFRNSESAFRLEKSETQVAAVGDILRQMKDTGIEASLYTYSSMLDGLLDAGHLREGKQINVPAARAVLDHMASEGIKPSPHIYTILISHYFNRNPPDLASIDGLWNRMQLEGGIRDHVFYDRMIEGYARVGAIEKMLAFLRRMPQEGKIPGWVALHAVLQSLVKVQEWDLVHDLVQDVSNQDGIFRNASRLSRGKKEFWGLVDDVRRRGIDLPEMEVN